MCRFLTCSRSRLAVVIATIALTLVPVLASADARGDAKKQVEFGILVAQKGLWAEAIYRWERATQIDPTYAAAWNNLAVAYEQQGRIAEARDTYKKALALDPKSTLISQNYDLFREIHDRASREDRR